MPPQRFLFGGYATCQPSIRLLNHPTDLTKTGRDSAITVSGFVCGLRFQFPFLSPPFHMPDYYRHFACSVSNCVFGIE